MNSIRRVAIAMLVCMAMNLSCPLRAAPLGSLPLSAPYGPDHLSQGRTPQKPLILIGEPSKDGGDDLWIRTGLMSRLLEAGYENGKTLFVCTPGEPYSDLDSGAYALRRMLDETVRATGCTALDVVAYGVSGLVLRFGVETGIIPDGLIDNAIMVGAPQRGSFLAELLFEACTVVEHECLFERETRYARFSPFGDVSPGVDPQTVPAKSTGNLPASIGSDDFAWESETWWVAKRAREIYEPLYGQYVQERFLSLPYVPLDSPSKLSLGGSCKIARFCGKTALPAAASRLSGRCRGMG